MPYDRWDREPEGVKRASNHPLTVQDLARGDTSLLQAEDSASPYLDTMLLFTHDYSHARNLEQTGEVPASRSLQLQRHATGQPETWGCLWEGCTEDGRHQAAAPQAGAPAARAEGEAFSFSLLEGTSIPPQPRRAGQAEGRHADLPPASTPVEIAMKHVFQRVFRSIGDLRYSGRGEFPSFQSSKNWLLF